MQNTLTEINFMFSFEGHCQSLFLQVPEPSNFTSTVHAFPEQHKVNYFCQNTFHVSCRLASVAQLDAHPTDDQEVAVVILGGSGKISFEEIDHEIFSTVILSLPLIQESQLSISGKRMCTSTG